MASTPAVDNANMNFSNTNGNSNPTDAQLGSFMHGARAIVKVNGKPYAFAFGVTLNIQTLQEEIWGIDDYTPIELAPSRIQVSGSLSYFHIPANVTTDTLKTPIKGFSLPDGQSNVPPEQLFQANVLSFLFHRYVTLEIRDSKLDVVLFQSNRVAITGRTQNFNTTELSNIVMTFKAIGWRNEMLPQYPKGYKQPFADPTSATIGAAAGAAGAVSGLISKF